MARKNTEYDITEAFSRIEDEIIASMMRNLTNHRAEETKEGYNWSQWQVEQLASLDAFKKRNAKKYGKEFRSINNKIREIISAQRAEGNANQEIRILEAVRKGFKPVRTSKTLAIDGEFFKINDRKMDALIKAVEHDFKKGEQAILRRANDQYRRIIFAAQVYANSGAGTYEKAVDMAVKDFLAAGINCIEYSNGARHTMKDYADMAIRTAGKRAYLTGEGEKRQEYGITTVRVNKRGKPCPLCLPFVGKVLIDDVWSGGKASDGPYPLMSQAISAGLYHPRCKDVHSTYIEGISSPAVPWTDEEIENIEKEVKIESKKNYAARQAEKFGRLAKYSLDADNQKKYNAREEEWKNIFVDGGSNYGLKEITSNDTIELKNNITDTDNQITLLKQQFSDITEGYSYDDWFNEFESIDDGFGGVPYDDESFYKLKELDSKIKDVTKKKNELLYQKEKRQQLDTGYDGKVPDDKLDEYNAKAFEQIKLDTGYSDKESKEFHDALKEYFGGDYGAILKGETKTARIIRNGLDRMPTYDGSVSRGMIFNNSDVKLFSELKQGDTLPRKGIIESWSSEQATAIAYSGISDYERSSVILECVDNHTGVGVQHLSSFGKVEAEVLCTSDYEVVEVVVENKYDYLLKHKEYLYSENDLVDEELSMKGNVVCRIRVKEKN